MFHAFFSLIGMLHIFLDPFGVVGCRQVLSSDVLHILGVLILDVGSELEILGDS